MALYVHYDEKSKEWHEKYYYSGGVEKIKSRLKKDLLYTKLGFKNKYKLRGALSGVITER